MYLNIIVGMDVEWKQKLVAINVFGLYPVFDANEIWKMYIPALRFILIYQHQFAPIVYV